MGKFSFSQEPAVYVGLATAIIGLVAVFWPNFLTADQQKAAVAFVVVVAPIVLSFVTRSQVSPVAKAAPAPPAVVPGP